MPVEHPVVGIVTILPIFMERKWKILPTSTWQTDTQIINLSWPSVRLVERVSPILLLTLELKLIKS